MEAEINCLTCAPKRAPNPPVFDGSLDLRDTTLTIYQTGGTSWIISLDNYDADAVLGMLASTEFSWDDPDACTPELTYVGDGDYASFSQLVKDIDQYQKSLAGFETDILKGRIPNKMFNTLEARTFHLAPSALELFVYLREGLAPILAEGGSINTLNALVAFGDQAENFLFNAGYGDMCAYLLCAPIAVPQTMMCVPCTPVGELI